MSARPLLSVFLSSVMIINLSSFPLRQDSPLEKKIQRVQKKLDSLKLERDASDLSPTSERLQVVLQETDAILQESERKIQSRQFPGEEIALLEGQREHLNLVDREFGAIFRDIESRLNTAGLTSKIQTLKGFEQHYRNQMAALQNALDGLVQAGRTANNAGLGSQIAAVARIGTARKHLTQALRQQEDSPIYGQKSPPVSHGLQTPMEAPERLNPSPGPHALPTSGRVQSNTSWFRTTSKKKISQPANLQADDPTPGDLAESPVVQLTPEIRAKAAALGNSPGRIYEFVRNNFEFEPYFGMLQNSQAVLWSGRGNNFDQGTLLIALLRAAKIPARYVTGVIRLTNQQAMNWVGVRDPQVAQNIVRIFAGSEVAGEAIRLNQRWVEAYVGNRWVPLDPSYKPKNYQPGTRIPRLPFDRMRFLSAVRSDLSTEVYVAQIREYLKQNLPGRGLSNLPYTGRIVSERASDRLPVQPYPVESITRRDTEIPRTQHQKIEVRVVGTIFGSTPTELLKTELSLPEVSLQNIAISFGGATASDQHALELFGGLDATPAFLVDLVPQIRLDEKVIAAGTQGLPVGNSVNVRVSYFFANATAEAFRTDHRVQVGGTAAIGLSGHQFSDRFVEHRIDQLVNGGQALGTGNREQTVRATLHIALMRYFQRLTAERRKVNDLMQFKYLQTRAEEGATSSTLNVQNLFDRPFVVTPSNMLIDADGLLLLFYDINSPVTDTPELTNFRQMIGLTSSSLEHELWEEIVLIDSISTTKALQVANERRIPILTINKDNATTELPKLSPQIPASFKQLMQTDIDNGRTIITPQQIVQYLNWRGLGWITESANAAAFGYLIGRLNPISSSGGDTSGNLAGTGPRDGSQGDSSVDNETNVGCPVTISNGNMFHQFDDLNISSRGFPILLRRTYNSQSTFNGPFGYGWTHSYNSFVQEGQVGVTYFNGSGGQFTFIRQRSRRTGQGDSFISPPGLNMTLTKDQHGFKLREKNGTEMRFDPAGRLRSVTDRNGNSQALTYDGQGNLQTIRDAFGRDITFTYNTQNKIVSVQDFTGRRLAYSYDSNSNLVESVDFGGNRTTYTYYNNVFNDHNLKTITFPEGNTITYVYYGDDKVFKTINPAGGEMRFIYLPLRRETVVIDERDFATTYQYNEIGNVTRIIDPDGNHTDRVFNNDAKLSSQTDEAGFSISFSYDRQGNLLELTDALGNKINFTYEPMFNQATSFKDAKGNRTLFGYDAKGNLTRITDALGAQTTFTYDNFGNLLTVTDAEGYTFSITYDHLSNPVEIRDALGNPTKFKFDVLMRITERADVLNNVIHYSYDELDRITRKTDELGNTTSFTYDRNGNLAQITDANNKRTRFAYDQLSNLTHVVDAIGNVTKYGYEAENCSCSATSNLTSVTNAKGHTWRYAYNFRDQVIEASDPLGNITNYSYDSRGNLIDKTDANGNRIIYEYDKLNRLVRRTYPNGTHDMFAYDENGNVQSVSNLHVILMLTFDARNRVTSVTDSRFQKAISYIYNRIGNKQMMIAPDGGVTTYAYDGNGQIKMITNPKGQAIRFNYDALRRRTEMVYTNNSRANYEYDAARRLVSLTHTNLHDHSIIGKSVYTHDKVGNRTSMTDLSGTRSYEYDGLYRLILASHFGFGDERYEYDSVYNRTFSTVQRRIYYDEANRLLRSEQGIAEFSYDKNGNLLSKDGVQGKSRYNYDLENRLIRIDLPDGRIATYKYDGFGRRIEKNVNGKVTKYFYDNGNILMEFKNDAQVAARYTHGLGIDEPLAAEQDGQSYFFHTDGLGSIIRLSNVSGGVAQSYEYDSFGQIINAQGAVMNSYTYTGREFDAESGLYYYRARYYDPQVGRFISQDPIRFLGGINFYSYVGHSPTNYTDPLGLGRIVKVPLEFGEVNIGEYKIPVSLYAPNPLADHSNTEFVHEHIIFEDGVTEPYSNRGYGSDGKAFSYPDSSPWLKPDNSYGGIGIPKGHIPVVTDLNDALLRRAASEIEMEMNGYSLIPFGEGNNCQSYVQKVLERYEKYQQGEINTNKQQGDMLLKPCPSKK